MIKAIKSIIAVGLLIGAVFLAYEIFLKTSEFQTELNKKKDEISQKIEELKQLASEKKAAMDKEIEKVNKSLSETTSNDVVSQELEDEKEKAGPSKEPSTAKDPAIRLNPMDEEDRELTAKVLGDNSDSELIQTDAAETTIETKEPTTRAANVSEGHPAEPIDFERMSRIRQVYSSTIEILDWE